MKMRDRIGAIAIVAVVIGLGVNLWYMSSQEQGAEEADSWDLGQATEGEPVQLGASSEEGADYPSSIASTPTSAAADEDADWISFEAVSAAEEIAEPAVVVAEAPTEELMDDAFAEEFDDAPTIAPAAIAAALSDVESSPSEYLPGLSEDEYAVVNQQTTRQRFAISRQVAWNSRSHGETTVGADGNNLWRLRVGSSSASSQNLYLNQVELPPEAELFLTDLSGDYTAGPYTSEDVYNGELWTAVVPGEELVVAVSSPAGSDFHLAVAEVNYGYDDFWAKKAGAGSKASGCNVDTVCQEGERWENERRSVARLTVFGRWLCSGTLVNNTAEDLTPYMLTAAHCLEVNGEGEAKAQRAANSMVSYWNFESSQCSGNADGSLSQSQSGASLKAMWSSDSSNGNDFALVEMNRSPALAHNVYFSGWDAREIAPTGVYSIHHPRGAEKSISASTQQTRVTNRGNAKKNGTGQYLSIQGWDYGVTEQGSSGSGLWNEGYLLVGQLWGGLSSCESPRQSDWYGRIASAWDGGGSPNTQLKVWLDPDEQGVNTHCGMNNTGLSRGPCNPNAVSGQVAANGNSSGSAPDTTARTVDDTAPASSGGGGGGGGGSLGVWLLAALVSLIAVVRVYRIRAAEKP